MDRIAVISDIHGNLPALDAVLADIRAKGIDRIICLGDIIGKGPSMKETIDLCINSCETVIKGNWEDYVSTHPENKKYIWFRDEIGSRRMEILSKLPLKTEFYMSGKLVRLFHAHPKDLYKRVSPDNPIEDKLELFNYCDHDSEMQYKRDADIVGYGDIHIAYMENFKNKVLFNVGSVGNPLDMPLAAYAVLEGVYGSQVESGFSVQFYRVPYNKELAISIARSTNMPETEAYVMEVKTAVFSR